MKTIQAKILALESRPILVLFSFLCLRYIKIKGHTYINNIVLYNIDAITNETKLEKYIPGNYTMKRTDTLPVHIARTEVFSLFNDIQNKRKKAYFLDFFFACSKLFFL